MSETMVEQPVVAVEVAVLAEVMVEQSYRAVLLTTFVMEQSYRAVLLATFVMEAAVAVARKA
jgi:hypothetical protein